MGEGENMEEICEERDNEASVPGETSVGNDTEEWLSAKSVEEMAAKFPLQNTPLRDIFLLHENQIFIQPAPLDKSRTEKKLRSMREEDKLWFTLHKIYEYKIEAFRRKKGNLAEGELIKIKEYQALTGRCIVAGAMFEVGISEDNFEENEQYGFPGFDVDEDYSVWLLKKPQIFITFVPSNDFTKNVVPEKNCGQITREDDLTGYV